MNVIPAIDLYEGKMVRLRQGDFNQITYYDLKPEEVLEQYENAGITDVHVVDLSSAKKGCMQPECCIFLNAIAESNLSIQYGGGVRSEKDIEFLFSKGVSRVVIGSLAVDNPDLVKKWLNQYGNDRIILALDLRIENAIPVIKALGWKKDTTLSLYSVLDWYKSINMLSVLCTDIDRDGQLQGPNVSLYESLIKQYADIHWIASGGVKDRINLYELREVGVKSVVVGKALYEKQITVSECLEARLW